MEGWQYHYNCDMQWTCTLKVAWLKLNGSQNPTKLFYSLSRFFNFYDFSSSKKYLASTNLINKVNQFMLYEK